MTDQIQLVVLDISMSQVGRFAICLVIAIIKNVCWLVLRDRDHLLKSFVAGLAKIRDSDQKSHVPFQCLATLATALLSLRNSPERMTSGSYFETIPNPPTLFVDV